MQTWPWFLLEASKQDREGTRVQGHVTPPVLGQRQGLFRKEGSHRGLNAHQF